MAKSTRRFTVSVVRSGTSRAEPARPVPAPVGTAGAAPAETAEPVEVGGVDGPEPTRYGDWEHKGRCTDF